MRNNRMLIENQWVQIKSKSDWVKVEELICGGHDGVIKDLQWAHQEYVDDDLNMVFSGKPCLWLLLQLQNETVPSIEFLLTGVEEMHVNQRSELKVTVDFIEDCVILQLSGDTKWFIKSDEISFKISVPALLGQKSFTHF